MTIPALAGVRSTSSPTAHLCDAHHNAETESYESVTSAMQYRGKGPSCGGTRGVFMETRSVSMVCSTWG